MQSPGVLSGDLKGTCLAAEDRLIAPEHHDFVRYWKMVIVQNGQRNEAIPFPCSRGYTAAPDSRKRGLFREWMSARCHEHRRDEDLKGLSPPHG